MEDDPKPKKLSLADVPLEWRSAVKTRAHLQGVDVDDVIRYGLHHDFKKVESDDAVTVLKEIRELLKGERKKT